MTGGDFIPKYRYTQSQLEHMQTQKWLSVRERKVFDMFYRDGLNIADIAAELDVSRRTVDRALNKIRNGANWR